MIETVHFSGFKSLADLRIHLDRFTVFIGANGAGKTSVLQGIHDLLRVVSAAPSVTRAGIAGLMRGTKPISRPARVFGGAHAPQRLVTNPGFERLSIEVTGPGFGSFGLTAIARAGREPATAPRFEVWHEEQRLAWPGAKAVEETAFFRPLLRERLGNTVFLALNARTAAAPHYSDSETPRVEYDGGGLAVVLQRLQGLRDGRFEAIEQALARVVPAVHRLRTVPSIVRRSESQEVQISGQSFMAAQDVERTGARVEVEVRGAGWLPLDMLSEGTVITLALLTVLHDQAPRYLLLDDLDKVMHPKAQGRVVGEIRAVLEAFPEIQVLTTTHSPYIIDHFAVEEVRVMRLLDDGFSACRPLSAHPRWVERSGYMLPGEFWSGVGEDWVGE